MAENFMTYLGASVLAYVSVSITLFCFPHLLHRVRRYKFELYNQIIVDPNRILKVAHRGGSRIGLQNTIHTFQLCMQKAQPDMIEMDVCFTKDKLLVVHHDSNLIRTCGIQKLIEHLDYKELPSFLPEVTLDFALGLTSASHSSHAMPLLEEVFQKFPNLPLNIQLKTPSAHAIQVFGELLKKYKREHITIWGIRGPLHNTLKQVSPNTMTFFNDAAFLKLFLFYITGLLPFFPIKDDSLQVPIWTTEYYKWKLASMPQDQKKIEYFFKGIKFMNFLLPPLIRHLRKRGIITMVWVCNSEEDFKRACDMEVGGIMTDDPVLLDEYLSRKSK